MHAWFKIYVVLSYVIVKPHHKDNTFVITKAEASRLGQFSTLSEYSYTEIMSSIGQNKIFCAFNFCKGTPLTKFFKGLKANFSQTMVYPRYVRSYVCIMHLNRYNLLIYTHH